MKLIGTLLAAFTLFLSSAVKAEGQKAEGIYGFVLPGLSGKDIKPFDFKGKVLLFVNTASHCGFTGQYAGLQKLHETFS